MLKRDNYDVPVIPLPAQYKNTPAKEASTSPTPATADASTSTPAVKPAPSNAAQGAGLVEWWRAFGNAELAALIDRGLANNPDVRISTQRMAQAQIRVKQARAGLLPTLSAPLEVAGGTIAPGAQGITSQHNFIASLQGSWRVDLWGEKRSLIESAKFQLWQASFDRDNAQRMMAASLAASYIEYLSLNDRLRVARETEEVLSHLLVSIQKRVAAGDATSIDFDQQNASIFAVRATIPSMEQQREDALTTIAFLVGTVPESLKLSNDGLDALALPSVVPSLPSSLLLRRPDVRMAEARLLSADADVDVARARILPPLDLATQLGHNSTSLSQLFQPSTLFWNTISTLTVSIFDGGKLKSDKENAQAVHEEMVETYARTIYQAAREVESALASIRLTGNRLTAQQEATVSARHAWDSSAKVYANGGLEYQALLDAERNYHNYLTQYLQIKSDSYHGYINLFQALGGGVNFADPLPGKGARPALAGNNALGFVSSAASQAVHGTQTNRFTVDGVDWIAGSLSLSGNSPQIENFWQVELPGLYHRSTIAATWRDLRARYPKLMENRVVRPLLNGEIENGSDVQMSLFHVYVSKFPTPEAAYELCTALKANFQRCRVVSSRSDETVAEPVAIVAQKTVTPAAPTVVSADTVKRTEIKRADISTGKPDNVAAKPDTAAPVAPPLAYTVQLGVFPNLEKAALSYAFWSGKKYGVYISEIKDTKGQIWYAVRTGVFQTRRDAAALAVLFGRREDVLVVVVRTPVDKTGAPAAVDIGSFTPQSPKTAPSVSSNAQGRGPHSAPGESHSESNSELNGELNHG